MDTSQTLNGQPVIARSSHWLKPVMSEALKPCPWCKGTDLRPDDTGYHGRSWVVLCMTMGCGVQGPFRDTVAAAVTAWNQREGYGGACEGN